ncbi:MAG: ABC transporter ATP-binding protein [Planctomycetes bacterium]|nr:ABC transporter ATP-binding protein [Planctomycetota bacterium]
MKVTNLSKIYRSGRAEVHALESVSFSVADGEFLAIMGASGSGKSTLLHLIGALDTPTSGEMEIDGVRLSGLSDRDLTRIRREKIGFIFQFFNLIPTLSARENVALPLMIARKDMKESGKRVDELLDLVHLSDRADHRPDELSGGEQQRVAIARSLVMDPAIILADEPTGNLDSHNADEIYALLRKLSDEFSRTVVMVTHDGAGAAHADRALFLKDGRIVGEKKIGKGTNAASVASAYQELAHPKGP